MSPLLLLTNYHNANAGVVIVRRPTSSLQEILDKDFREETQAVSNVSGYIQCRTKSLFDARLDR